MRRPVRIVTLYRPWCRAIAQGIKPVENRTWRPDVDPPWYAGIRSGQTWDAEGALFIARLTGAPLLEPESWPAGRVVAVAEVTAHWPPGREGGGRWRDLGQWGWCLGRVAALPSPVVWPPRGDNRIMKGLVSLDLRNAADRELLAAMRDAWKALAGAAAA